MKRPIFKHFNKDVEFEGHTFRLRMFRLGALIVTYSPKVCVTWEPKRNWVLSVLRGEI
jgi:hypothetical protein